jgi:5-methylcytosine-specific restriction endonuclease McrA
MKTENRNSKCLLLNSDYSPLSIISWKKAIVWSFRSECDITYGIEIIDFFKNDHINGVNKKYPIPAVARTKGFFRINNSSITFSRKNIYIRDNYTCQYCDIIYSFKDLTYDHVIPKSKWLDNNGSPTNWTNIVTACIECNRKKGNRTPTQANMPLKKLPSKPQKNIKFLPISSYLSTIKDRVPQEWLIYIPESYKEITCQHTHTNV